MSHVAEFSIFLLDVTRKSWSMGYSQRRRVWDLQGTVLRPLLFLLFINDIPNNLSAGTTNRLFAKDCRAYRPIRSIENQILMQKTWIHLKTEASHGKCHSTHQNATSWETSQDRKQRCSTSTPCTARSWKRWMQLSRPTWGYYYPTTFTGLPI